MIRYIGAISESGSQFSVMGWFSKKTRITATVVFLFLCLPSFAAEVLFVDISTSPSVAGYQLDLVCQFYGLNVERSFAGKDKNHRQLVDALKQEDILAVVISTRALANLEAQLLLPILRQEDGKSLPLMIVEVIPETDSNILREWSGGMIVRCTSFSDIPFEGFYRVSDQKVLAQQLAGQEIPFNAEHLNYLALNENRNPWSIIQLKSGTGETLFPVFVKTMVNGQEVFFQTQNQLSEPSAESSWRFDSDRFLEIAPLMMFLRYACGERCWHSPGRYANLTIDDPWLTEPYGHLSYVGLLEEMEKANFHTTIAFIPWNYDRSASDVVSLFHDHQDRFSICVHGNNHDHYEFYKYDTNINDPWPVKPLSVQEANIKQAIARMEEFRNLTGLSCDHVMVFPHGIAPAKTLALLKRYNFLATSNAGHIPLGSNEPNDALFWLRSVTLDFENFISLKRYPAKGRTKADIAIDLFLGNPIVFYGHHDLFKDGIDSFNELVEVVNKIEPSVKWQSLAYIARHLYLKRIRGDGNYDIRAFCRSIELENTQMHDLTYFVRKEESFFPPIRLVTVDGELYPHKRSNSDLSLKITIPAGESRTIDIEYENNLDLTSIDISKNDPRVNRLRKLSDLRDITLSKNVLGRAMIHMYYETDLYKLGLKRLTIICFVLSAAMGVGGWYVLRRIRRRHLQRTEIGEQTEE